MANFWRRFGRILGGMVAAVRAFIRALKHSPSGSRRALLAAPSQPPLALPASYGSSKVALIAVNPYLVHAFWDVDTSRLPPGTKCAVLRFHDISETAPGPSFDVDVDLRAPNWYVHLWSPAKSYYAALAVKTESGQFIPLATSNRIETPRAWPAAETPLAETPAGLSEPRPLGSGPITPVAPLSTPSPAAAPRPVRADEVLRQRLAQIYALRSQPRPAKAMAAAASSQASGAVSSSRAAETPAAPHPDLTALAEHQFSPGLPSSQYRDSLSAP